MTTGERKAGPISVRVYELPPITVDDSAVISVRVVYTCPHCTRSLRIRPEYFGASLACKHCDCPFVPSLAQAISHSAGLTTGTGLARPELDSRPRRRASV